MTKPTIFQRIENIRTRTQAAESRADQEISRIMAKYQKEFLNPLCQKNSLNFHRANGRYWFEYRNGVAMFDSQDASAMGCSYLFPVFPVLAIPDLRRGWVGNRLKPYNCNDPLEPPRGKRSVAKEGEPLDKKEIDARVHAHGMGQVETRDIFIAWLTAESATDMLATLNANGGWPPDLKKPRGRKHG